jgi:hypothetical protein
VPNSQFIQDEEILLINAFDALSEHFVSRDSFLVQYNQISEQSSKLRFLRLTSIYRALIKKGNFIPPSDALPTSLNYYDITYKFIALISIIEAMFSPDEWLDFYRWLRKPSNVGVFPIEDHLALDRLYERYNSEYGAIRSAVRFFKALELPEQEFLKSKLTRLRLDQDKLKASEIESTISELAKLLYNVRSEFMHKARLIVEFGDIPAITANREGKPFISNLSLNSLMRIFESGLLRHFGIQPERNIFLF